MKTFSYHFISLDHFFIKFQIDDLSIPPVEELPSLDAVMSEIDSDMDSLNSNLLADHKFSQTPTPSFDDRQQTGSILRHVIFQGITAQIGSAAVSFPQHFCCFFNKFISFRIERKLDLPQHLQCREWLP